jgi:Tfp pilus assembly protein PilN
MKAVNLLPREAQRSFGVVRGMGGGTTMLFGALVAGLVLVALFVVSSNQVTSKREQLNAVNTMVDVTQREVAQLKPYADLESLRQSLLERVRSLSDSRYDWPVTLSRMARAFPADATLTSFEGANGTDAGAAPSVSLAGCTPSHNAVARLIDRLRAVKGVQGVALESSTVVKTPDAACPRTEQFKVKVALAAATTPGATPGQPAPTAGGPK